MNTDSHRWIRATSVSICITNPRILPGRKGFFFAKSSRLRGESWAGLSPRRREAREENAKDFSLVAAMLLCVHQWFQTPFGPCARSKFDHFVNFVRSKWT